MKDPHQAIKNYEALLKFLELVKERIAIERKYSETYEWDGVAIGLLDKEVINLIITVSGNKNLFRDKQITAADLPGLSRPHQDRIRYLKNKHGEDKD